MTGRTGSTSENTIGDKEILAISRGTSVVLLVVYAAYREPIGQPGDTALMALNSIFPTLDSRIRIYS